MQTARTPEELKNPDFNYYIAFVIDPVDKDPKRIETTMAQKKNTFTQGTPVQRRLKDLYAEAVLIMTDKTSREEEYKNAKRFKMDTAKSAITAIARGRGSIYKSDLKKMADASGKWLTVDEIEKEITYLVQQGIKIIDDTKTSLDFLTYDKVDKLLKTATKNDLYELLGNSPSASTDILLSAVTALYNSVSGKSDNKSTAINQICGEANKILKDAKSKKNYDIYLATKDIWSEFALRRSTGISEMELKEYLAYSEKAKTALRPIGISSVDEIEVLLAEGLNYYRIAVAGGGGAQVDLESCPYCNLAYANIGNPKACPHCHQPLEIVCWNCGGKAPFTVKKTTCPNCGATKEHSSRFDTIIKKIDNLLLQPGISITDIQTELNNLKNILPDYKKAPSAKIAKKVTEYQDRVDKKVQEEETTGKAYKADYEKIQELLSQKKYFSASSAAATLKTKYPLYNVASSNAMIASISAEIAKAKQFVDRANLLATQNNEDSAIDAVATALNLCEDYEEAKQIVAKFPLRAPQSVSAVIRDKSAMITWTHTNPQKLTTYTVIRKNGSAPKSISEGTIVAQNLTIKSFEDTTIVSDTPYFYAVFTTRWDKNSPIVSSTTPIVTYFDVYNIRQTIVPGKISIQWDAPLNISEVEVIKKKGNIPPTSPTDGVKITTRNNQAFEDSDYDRAGNSYLFICVYKDDKGVIHRSKGITDTFKAFEELKPLTNVKIEHENCIATTFTLTSDRITTGRRGLYYDTKDVSCKYDCNLQIVEFKNFYKTLQETSLMATDDRSASFNLPAGKSYYLYPFVANEQLISIAKPQVVTTITPIKQVVIAPPNRDNEIVIKGQPDTNAKNIIVMVSNIDFPVTPHSDGIKHTVPRDTLTAEGFRLKLKANTQSYITFFAETQQDNIKSITTGVKYTEPISIQERVTVWYKMSEKSSSKPFTFSVAFRADAPTTIPSLSLVRGNPCPLSISEGTLVDRSTPITLKKGLFTGGKYVANYAFKCDGVPVNTKFALFLTTPNSSVTLKQVRSF